ncbi:PC4/YdbC family ssDNA-binding protein [Bradyrhizobium sp. CCGUVB14]|uniref:PC4/YdbC family ssDNA-binding protein n=1 Tax=Bradyrhizobium sp. CCGUVB14 TaxID=2949628 RepID=UPI0020B18263|nr:PC4/YdbC family ssDNA-binding protein [Bradyrhizobium sp. CCGUVB14]MCP3444191.1 transcriptional coactivator p15/PC4 family protein [Bradyrhizobium sp. CCGUVB14]
MTTKPPALPSPRAPVEDNRSRNSDHLIDRRASTQVSIPTEIAHIGAIWRSPRDKSTCIQGALKTYNSNPYFDLRLFELDHAGRMRPTSKGITVSPQRLMQLAKLVGDAARTAARLGLIPGSSA